MPPGFPIVCRGWPWRVVRVASATDVLAVTVQSITPDAPAISTLLAPFDHLAAQARTPRWRSASRHRVRGVIAALDGGWPEIPLASLSNVTTVAWPHQVVPALALTRGRGVRLLVADEVGLGKTMAAGLAIAELAARDLAARVLVLTPAGLRDQWRLELNRHLGITADVVDAAALAALTRDVPADRSPWVEYGCWILSLEFAKQPTVLRSLAQDAWDVLVIDEAHTVSGDSQRASAVRALALQSRIILMLTATPHGGAPLAFRNLLALGAHDPQDPLVWIRRGRSDLGLPRAKTSRTWRLRPTADEMQLQQALHAYAARVDRTKRQEARLAMIVLKKRALSSPDALLSSLQRRLAHLAGTLGPIATTAQLPFEAGESDDDDDLHFAALTVPGLGTRDDELAELQRLIGLADRARHSAVKYRALEHLVTRTAETAVLFTEYRDTLRVVASRLSSISTVAILHGGLDRTARRDAVQRFTTGEARFLVATDAAAEGLNLQARCRFVVHIDLPWSPTTLAQRVGRVDRIGQSREVRVWQLAGSGGHEATVVTALARRFRRIHRDLGTPVPREWAQVSYETSSQEIADSTPRAKTDDLAEMAANIARAAGLMRCFRARAAPHPPTRGRGALRGIPWLRSRRAMAFVGRGVLFLFTVFPRCRGEGRTHVAVHVSLERLPREAPKTWLPWLAERAAHRASLAVPAADPLRASAHAREEQLLARSDAENRRLRGRWQPSLFDERAARVIEVAREGITQRSSAHSRRLTELSASTDAPTVEPVLALIVE